jgi:phosphoribosylanthranilate isomerase
MKIKICGLTRVEDALYAQQQGAFALGFIFYPPSKRFIPMNNAQTLLAELPAEAAPVGVFVNQPEDMAQAVQSLPLKGIQLHGDETPDDCRRLRGMFDGFIIKAFRIKNGADLDAIAAYEDVVDYILLDAAVDGAYGGTGQLADWDLARRAVDFKKPLILSGGITPDNIAAAARAVRPFAVDLAGGVESAPGVKSHDKIKQLFDAVNLAP